MTVKEFIETLVEPNTLMRLQYKIEGGHEEVNEDSLEMEWQIKDGEYADRKVVGVTDILYPNSHYKDAVNLVIER